VPCNDPKRGCAVMKQPESLSNGGIDEGCGSLRVGRQGQCSVGRTVLPTAGSAESYDQLPKSWISMIQMSIWEREQLAGEVARDTAPIICKGREMAFLRRQEISCHSGTAGVIELLRVRLRLTLYGLDVTEIGFAAVNPTYPKTRRREALTNVLTPKKIVYSRPNLRRAVDDDCIVTLQEGGKIVVIQVVFDDLLVFMTLKHVLEVIESGGLRLPESAVRKGNRFSHGIGAYSHRVSLMQKWTRTVMTPCQILPERL